VKGEAAQAESVANRNGFDMTDAQEMPMDPELRRAINYAQKLLDAALDVVGAARIELNENWARDPKIVGLTILSRSISNFRASVRLVQQDQPLEAQALVRLMYENLLWIAALRERGLSFVEDMRNEEAFNRKALGKLTLKTMSEHGGDVSGADALKLRNIINNLSQQFPQPKKMNAAKTAAEGGVEMAYCEYLRLSLDAVHCSVTALGHHLWSERTNDKTELVLSIVPRTTPAELLSTVLHACRALIQTAVHTNELVGFTAGGETFTELVAEFERNGWLER
jgi:hypothetical protein